MLFSNGNKHMGIKSWEVSDTFWGIVEPLIPKVKRSLELWRAACPDTMTWKASPGMAVHRRL
jgi:hypothetical protein